MATAFASRNKDNVALAGICVIILQNEELVYSVLLKDSDLNYRSDRTNKALVEDDILLPANLDRELCVSSVHDIHG
jgi:hypothetical protein